MTSNSGDEKKVTAAESPCVIFILIYKELKDPKRIDWIYFAGITYATHLQYIIY